MILSSPDSHSEYTGFLSMKAIVERINNIHDNNVSEGKTYLALRQ